MNTPMPTTTGPCGLCDEEGPFGSRNHGLDLCEPCTEGYVRDRLAAFGAQIEVEEVERTTGRNRQVVLELHVVGQLPQALPLMAKFRPRGFSDRIAGLFGNKGFLSGDALFDGSIVAETKTADLLRTMLTNEGFQSAVMALVGACGSWEIKPGKIDVRASLEELDFRAEVPLAVACVLRHLANAA